MKKKLLIFICLLFFIALIILWRVIFVNTFCEFYNICEWGIYLFIVPTVSFIAFLIKRSNPLLIISAITLGVIISILLTRNWATGFILQKLITTLLGSLFTCLTIKLFEGKKI